MLAAAGIANVNIDLIAGLSGQTAASWNESLDWIERLAPPHVSVYMLEVDEDSRLGREMLLGGVRYGAGDIPGDDAIAAFYETAVERLAAIGHPALRDFQLRAPRFRIAAQPEVLEAGAVRGLRRRRPFLRWPHAPAESGERGGVSVGRPAPPAVEARAHEERFFVGLRLMEGVRPEPGGMAALRRPIQRCRAKRTPATAQAIFLTTFFLPLPELAAPERPIAGGQRIRAHLGTVLSLPHAHSGRPAKELLPLANSRAVAFNASSG